MDVYAFAIYGFGIGFAVGMFLLAGMLATTAINRITDGLNIYSKEDWITAAGGTICAGLICTALVIGG